MSQSTCQTHESAQSGMGPRPHSKQIPAQPRTVDRTDEARQCLERFKALGACSANASSAAPKDQSCTRWPEGLKCFRSRPADDLRRRRQSAVRTMDVPPRLMRTRSLACGVLKLPKLHPKAIEICMPRRRIPVFTRVSAWCARGISASQRVPAQGEARDDAGLNPAVLTAQVGRPDFPGVSAVDL